MNDQQVSQQFQEAEADLAKARSELYKPSSDVVNYSACVSARKALYKFLETLYLIYLSSHNGLPNDSKTLDDLVDYCSKHNQKIKELDFSSVYCSCQDLSEVDDEEIFYCNDALTVQSCANLAEQVRKIVLDTSPEILLSNQ